MRLRRWGWQAWLIGLVMWGHGFLAFASEAPVQVQALGVHQDASSGARFIAVQFTLEDGWHLYWEHPGDSGQAPGFEVAPADATKPPVWPYPSRLQTPPLASYGYDHQLVLPAQVLRDDAELVASVHWLACAETCVPGQAQLRWSRATLQAAGQQPRIAQALRDVPQRWPADWQLEASCDGHDTVLAVAAKDLGDVEAATFYPSAAGSVDENQPKVWGRDGTRLTLRFAAGRAFKQLQNPSLDGVLVLHDAQKHARAFAVHTDMASKLIASLAPSGTVPAQSQAANATLASPQLASLADTVEAMLLACLGGMLLNLMPCVFPVLSMKVLGYINTSGSGQALRRRHAWWYALGNIVTLTGIGVLLLVLRATGQRIGWGFQMQSSVFVMGTAQLMFVLGLSQLGLLSFGERLMGIGQSRVKEQSSNAAFWTGVLTVVVATPCSAPFMGVATAAALVAPAALGVALFAAIGLGVALPYLALCYIEPIARRLPRPGVWMVRVREVSGLCLWGSCIWLLWIVGQQCGAGVMATGLAGCLLMGTAAWLRQLAPASQAAGRAAWLCAALGIWAGLWPCYTCARTRGEFLVASADMGRPLEAWQPYSAAQLARLRAGNQAVFVDFTAAWCVSCQLNETWVLDTAQGDALFRQHHVARLRADWTDQNAEITQALAHLGRSSVPLYVLYPSGADKAPQILPAVLTPGILHKALKQAH